MPVEERVHLRWIETGEVRHLFPMSFYPRSIQREDWKGGRSKHKAGYVMLRIPDHPRAGTSGYVFEHILVMERVLGRYVLPDESVHHRNGVRHDNRAENLELWVRPQPNGIRVQDAVAWAREILDRYGASTPPTALRRDA